MAPKRPRHLSSDAEREEFERRYGKEHGDRVWGATLAKVAEEQAARSPSGVKVEEIPGHVAYSDRGRRYEVRPHEARFHAHPHSRGSRDHDGPCSRDCRAGRVPHPRRR